MVIVSPSVGSPRMLNSRSGTNPVEEVKSTKVGAIPKSALKSWLLENI